MKIKKIFESPDQGRTVYSRNIMEDSVNRNIVQEPVDLLSYRIWRDILNTAEQNPTLQSALDRVIMLYELVKTESKLS